MLFAHWYNPPCLFVVIVNQSDMSADLSRIVARDNGAGGTFGLAGISPVRDPAAAIALVLAGAVDVSDGIMGLAGISWH
jgi:hypothetical protein